MRINALQVDWREVYAGQVREIQARYTHAHAALLNWARWTREIKGIYPCLAPCHIWTMGKPDEGHAGEDDHGAGDTTHRKRSEPLTEVKSDPLDEEESLERIAVELDVRLTHADFPTTWRMVIKAAYCYKRVPIAEHQYPHEAGFSNPNDFLTVYDACLAFLDAIG